MSISTMNNVIRDNRKLLKRRKKPKFVHIPGAYGNVKKEKYDHVALKPEVLKDIRERLQKERKVLFRKRIITFCIVILALCIVLVI